ncbi:lipoprotein, partial [Candidatus Magnetobacterium bavaricum]
TFMAGAGATFSQGLPTPRCGKIVPHPLERQEAEPPTFFSFSFFAVLLLILQVALLLSCTKEIRYTEDEIREFSPEAKEHIRNGEITFFMAPEEVRFAIGSPTDILVLPPTSDGKERVQWIYKKWGGAIKTELVFVGNRLMEITSNDPNLKRR